MKKRQQNLTSKEVFYPDNKDAFDKSARIIENGGLIVFPTKGIYGIGADINNEKSVKKIFEIKQRPLTKPILILIKDLLEVEKYCKNVPIEAFSLMEKFWPGDITFVLEASDKTPDSLTAGTGMIGVRIPSHPFTKELLKVTKRPITGTSANISEMPSPGKPNEIDRRILDKTDLFINAGDLGSKIPSTILKAKKDGIEILREGRVKSDQLKNFL